MATEILDNLMVLNFILLVKIQNKTVSLTFKDQPAPGCFSETTPEL